MKESFTNNVEATTKDSDPKYLQFERLSVDPALGGGEGTVKSTVGLTLPLFTLIDGTVPGTIGPRIGDLTGGVVDEDRNLVALEMQPPVRNDDLVTGDGTPHAVTFSQLEYGSVYVNLQFTDMTNLTIMHSAATIKALAIAQGVGSLSSAYISLPVGDLAGVVGKVVNYTINGPDETGVSESFTASNGLNAAASTIDFVVLKNPARYILNLSTAPSLEATLPTPSNDTFTILTDDYLCLKISLVGTAPISGNLDLTFTLDDSSTVGPFHITADQIITNADGMGEGNWTDYNDPTASVSFGWDLSGLIGKTIASIEYDVTVPFTSTGFALGLSRFYIAVPGKSGGFNGLSIASSGSMPFSHIVGPSIPTFAVVISWLPDPSSYVPLAIVLDAPSILAACTPTQLTLQSSTIDMYGTLLSPTYDGWTVGGIAFANMVHNYGPATLTSPSQILVSFTAGENGLLGECSPEDVPGTWSEMPYSPIVVSSGAKIQLDIALFPGDTLPSYGSIVVTEPYELRCRNLPLFKFRLFGPGTDVENGPTFDAYMLGSQGSAGPTFGSPSPSNAFREWCPLPFDVLKYDGTIATSQPVVHVPVNERMGQILAGVPDGFSGCAVYPPKLIVGPWNYIRFVLVASEGKVNTDYTNCYLQITGSAREVF